MVSCSPVPASRPPGVREAGGRLTAAHSRHHVGVGPVLEEGQGQRVHKVEILRGAGVLDHVHQRQEDVVRPLREPDIRVQAVLK